MALFITILQFFVGLSILIVLHELGHFLAAIKFGVRVEKFYLFFDFLFPLPEVAKFSLFKKKVGDTEYGIGWFPFGGYVQMTGIMDESMDKEALKEPVKPYEFRAKPAWQRLIILLGGIIMNVLVAFVLYSWLAFGWGDRYLEVENQSYGVYVDSTGAYLGLQNGDIVTHINGKKMENSKEVKMEMILSLADNITYQRNGQSHVIDGIDKLFYKRLIDGEKAVLFETAMYPVVDTISNPVLAENGLAVGDTIVEFEGKTIEYFQDLAIAKRDFKDQIVHYKVLRDGEVIPLTASLDENGNFGFGNLDPFEYTTKEYSFVEALVAGPVKTWETLRMYIRQFKLMFDPVVKGFRKIGGFGTIAQLYSGGFSLAGFLATTAFLSIILAFMNLLPIPALDGGHAVFTIYEMIFRKPPPEKFMYYAQLVGMAILFTLLIYANGNDVIRGIQNWFGK